MRDGPALSAPHDQGMNPMNAMDLWQRYRRHLCRVPALGLTLDVSRMRFDAAFIEKMRPALASAFAAMDGLEKGAIANPDEKRMVGHYWLRNAALAPNEELRRDIEDTNKFVTARACCAWNHS